MKEITKVKNLNYPLIIGIIVISVLIIISVFGEQLVSLDPYAMNFRTIMYKNGEMISIEPQMPPNDINIWGTDVLGRDIFSQIIAGAKVTLTMALLITLFRTLVALPIAFYAGFGRKVSRKIIDFFDKAFSALPALVFCIIILNYSFIKNLKLDYSIMAYVFVLTFVGWGRLSKVFKDRIEDILNQDFIEGEIAIGKSKVLIALQNVLPHLTATIIIHMFLEMSRALILLAQLGVFQVYVGTNKLDPSFIMDPAPKGLGLDFMPSYEAEWGAMLGSSRYAMMAGKPFLVLPSTIAFFISIMGFNLMGEGLKTEVNKRSSMVITWIKRIPYHLSPKTIIYELRNINNNKKSIGIKLGIIMTILIISLIPVPDSLFVVDSQGVFSNVEEFTENEGRMYATSERDNAAKYIVNRLGDYNLKPLFEDGFIQDIEISEDTALQTAKVSKSKLSIINDDYEIIEAFDLVDNFTFNKIFYFNRSREMTLNYDLSARILTEEQFNNKEFITSSRSEINLRYKGEDREHKTLMGIPGQIAPFFLVVDDDTSLDIDEVSHMDEMLGIIRITKGDYPLEDHLYGSTMPYYEHDIAKRRRFNGYYPFVITVDKETGEKIKSNSGKVLSLHNELGRNSGILYKNIGGVIAGKEDSKKDKLVITTNYDYKGKDSKGLLYNGSSIGVVLEIAKTLSNIDKVPNRDIEFLIFDGSLNNILNSPSTSMGVGTGANSYIKEILDDSKDKFIIALNNLGARDSDKLYLDTSRSSTQQKEYFNYVKYIKKRAKDLEIDLEQYPLVDGTEDLAKLNKFGGKGIMIESINSEEQVEYGKIPQNDIKLLSKDKLSKQAQLILDTIINIAYDKE